MGIAVVKAGHISCPLFSLLPSPGFGTRGPAFLSYISPGSLTKSLSFLGPHSPPARRGTWAQRAACYQVPQTVVTKVVGGQAWWSCPLVHRREVLSYISPVCSLRSQGSELDKWEAGASGNKADDPLGGPWLLKLLPSFSFYLKPEKEANERRAELSRER